MATNPERESASPESRSDGDAPARTSPLDVSPLEAAPTPGGPPADSGPSPTTPPESSTDAPESAPETSKNQDLATNPEDLPESSGTSPTENRSNTSEEATNPASGPHLETSEATLEDPDAHLVAAAQEGSTDAFSQLVARHQDKVYTRIFYMVHDAETAADLVQEAFLKVYRGLHLFRSEARFSTWLHRIAVNVCLHHFEYHNAQKRAGKVVSLSAMRGEDNEEFEVSDHSQRPDTQSELTEQQDIVLRAMAELDPQYRTALTLRELQGYSYQEIERLMDIPIGTVKSKIFRARQILQEKLKGLL